MNKTDLKLQRIDSVHNVRLSLAEDGMDYYSLYKCELLKDKLELYKRIKKSTLNKKIKCISKNLY